VPSFGPIRMEPKPRQKPTIPLEIGGRSPAALRRAGRLGDGWIEIGASTLDDVKRDLEVVERHRAEAGRLDEPFEVTLSSAHARDPDAVRRCEDIGVTRVISGPRFDGPPSAGTVIDAVKRFADDVISRGP
jgi:alkanesulfonate monooxygenase SsuD/methylene tetrahydromethanopterin reductase-like flavin-dependent oxidoreductase (luciferase family)